MNSPLPLPLLPVKSLRAVFSDLDDTLTCLSTVKPRTYQALWDLKDHHFTLVVVSGRPAGWADCLMRLWPIDAMVFENGAGVMIRDGKKLIAQTLAKEPPDRRRLEAIYEELRKLCPNIKKASDQNYRLFDMAIDFAEEPPFLNSQSVDQLISELSNYPEVTAKLSSIHINYWLGKHTKVTACQWLLSHFGLEKSHVVYCGDSPNDEPLFEFFEHSVGVANIAAYLPRLRTLPRYLTTTEGGEGFCEVASRLLP